LIGDDCKRALFKLYDINPHLAEEEAV